MFFRKSEAFAERAKFKRKENLDTDLWDKKKIVVTLFFAVVVILVAIEVRNMFFPKNEEVLGESEENKSMTVQKPNIKPPSLNIVSEVESRIDEIKKNIKGLNAEEVATSSPQIQKVLRDMQGIKDLPSNQAKEMCLRICSGI